MAAQSPSPRRRATRLRLYVPFLLLVLLAIGWSVAWFVIRGRVLDGMDSWLAAEAAAGRRWTCPDRGAGGYPFRIELTCSSLSVERADLSGRLGRVLAVAQIYAPSHVIVEAQGPLRLEGRGAALDATWRLLQGSIVFGSGRFQRAALAADAIAVKGDLPPLDRVDVASRRLEVHLRPNPQSATTTDLAVESSGTVASGLDALLGGDETSDVTLLASVTQTDDLPARPSAAELDRWRSAGGRLEVTRAALAKGARRLELKGNLGFDEAHRPLGRIEASALGLEGLLGRLVGDMSVLGGRLLDVLAGGSRGAAAPSEPGRPALKPIPPVRLENGRVFLGPLPIPGLRLPPLY